jgi:hypothetical protein
LVAQLQVMMRENLLSNPVRRLCHAGLTVDRVFSLAVQVFPFFAANQSGTPPR